MIVESDLLDFIVFGAKWGLSLGIVSYFFGYGVSLVMRMIKGLF